MNNFLLHTWESEISFDVEYKLYLVYADADGEIIYQLLEEGTFNPMEEEVSLVEKITKEIVEYWSVDTEFALRVFN